MLDHSKKSGSHPKNDTTTHRSAQNATANPTAAKPNASTAGPKLARTPTAPFCPLPLVPFPELLLVGAAGTVDTVLVCVIAAVVVDPFVVVTTPESLELPADVVTDAAPLPEEPDALALALADEFAVTLAVTLTVPLPLAPGALGMPR